MNLYKISQDINNDYDTYDSALVAAENEDHAKRTNPCGFREWSDKENCWMFCYSNGERGPETDPRWVDHIDQVKVELLGVALPGLAAGVLMSSSR